MYFIIYLCACTRMHVLHVVCMCVHSPGAFSYALLCVSVHGILMCMCAGEVRLANSPREYLIVSHFRGSKEDTELQIGGEVWCKLVTRIREENSEAPGDLQPRKKRLVDLPPHTYV